MPKDQWRRANDKSRFGTRPRRGKYLYTVMAGKPCFIRPAGGRDWSPYTTTKVTVFPAFAWKSGRLYGFYKDGYEMKVMSKFVCVSRD